MRHQPAAVGGSIRAPQLGPGGTKVGAQHVSCIWYFLIAHYQLHVHSFIPEGTSIAVPVHAIHRDPRYFSPIPNTFWSERWLKPLTPPLCMKSDGCHNQPGSVPSVLLRPGKLRWEEPCARQDTQDCVCTSATLRHALRGGL